MPKRITLKDVATQAGVSYQTVSKVINGKASVSEETETHIWQTIESMGYRPNVSARNLRTQASHLIGYSWVPSPVDQINPILDQFLTALVGAAETAGYHILLFPSHPEEDPVEVYRNLIHTGRVDAFVLSTTNYDDPRIQALLTLEFPFVALGRANPEWHFPYVDVDGRQGTYDATTHLIEQGHERIGLLAWPEGSRVGASRTNGYLDALAQAGKSPIQTWIQRAEGTVRDGYHATTQLLNLPEEERPTAVVAVQDQLAIGAIQAAQQAGLQIGREFGVTGFDDSPGIQHLMPPLTSVRQPMRAAGQHLIQLLVDLVKGKEIENKQVLLAPQVIVRSSSLRL